ncbi:hypothetical protein [Ensifer sp. 22564]|uniref:hypothetical protein n=1 Tax=Ensifer sp. 22564 TaxID=3453943 RepID=UPI003F832EBB
MRSEFLLQVVMGRLRDVFVPDDFRAWLSRLFFGVAEGAEDERGRLTMAGIFRSLKRVLTGQVIRQSDIQIMNGTCVLSLRVKRESGSGRFYVVLAAKASGNYQYYPLEPDEFERLFDAAIETRVALQPEIGEAPKL